MTSTLGMIFGAIALLFAIALVLLFVFMTWPGGGTQRANPDQHGDDGEARKPGDGF